MIYDSVELYNVQALLEEGAGRGATLSRVPDALRLRLNALAREYALQPAGCEIRFNLESDRAKLHLQSPQGPAIVEIYQGSFFAGWHVIGDAATELVVDRPPANASLARATRRNKLPFDETLIRVLLPWGARTELLGVEGRTTLPDPEQTPGRKYLAYGSSITQGYSGICPSDSYAQRAARLLGVDLINLGFAGGAHLEPEMACYIASRDDWDFATLEMGINLVRGITTDEFERRVRYFVTTIAQHHPGKWIFCIDLFTCFLDFENDPQIAAFRDVVRDTVHALALPRLVHLAGTELLTSPCGLTQDLLHPARFGMEEMAQNLVHRIADKIGDRG